MQRARADNGTTVVSIFVNPRQFGDPADLARYPRNEAHDVAVCEAEGVDIVFAPSVDEVYPPGFDSLVRVGAIAQPLEGSARPGHFDGVATVVAILFGLVRAEQAYFGQKDAQQVAVIRRMSIDLAIPTEVVACPTIREPDGLAMSSRNKYLSPMEREQAVALSLALDLARSLVRRRPLPAAKLKQAVKRFLQVVPAARLEYVEVFDPETLRPVREARRGAQLALAVFFGKTRLIDNAAL